MIYGARNPGLLLYKDELEAWAKRDDINLNVTVDKGDATWKGREGFVPTVCKEVAPSSENAVTVICGPPIMIRFTLPVFFDLGFSKENIITSLEMRMKCGIGKCGRCNVGEQVRLQGRPGFLAGGAGQTDQGILIAVSRAALKGEPSGSLFYNRKERHET